jgi:hypothetical protein
MMMIACAVFGFVMNSVGSIFKDFYKLETEIEDKLYLINNFMDNKNIN